ncbi:expressed unknown protein [Seminavis robusta]|uniref:Uncharacterized protein n=1 Tax=Seminavis robusta TaxID=568900 RepID=A0A9N8EWH1_9STRA|nr:expressed unknown protein [Seminavis robusta]|eukprot:Sro1761_g295900.1 n/a (253) ;mRNA; f:2220-2978
MNNLNIITQLNQSLVSYMTTGDHPRACIAVKALLSQTRALINFLNALGPELENLVTHHGPAPSRFNLAFVSTFPETTDTSDFGLDSGVLTLLDKMVLFLPQTSALDQNIDDVIMILAPQVHAHFELLVPVLYNAGFFFHQQGICTGRSSLFLKGIKYYHTALNFLDFFFDPTDAGDLVMRCALFNNLGHASSVVAHFQDADLCLKELKKAPMEPSPGSLGRVAGWTDQELEDFFNYFVSVGSIGSYGFSPAA